MASLVARSILGRPRVPNSVKRISQSVTLGPPVWKWVHDTAKLHGVGRSQIFDDALKAYRGEMEDLLKHLREEIASQEENVKTLLALSKQKDEELHRLKASQQMVGSILSPYGGPGNDLSKEAKEKARTLRATIANPNNVYELHLLLEGKQQKPLTPILAQAFQAWGSWQAVMEAVLAAQKAKETA